MKSGLGISSTVHYTYPVDVIKRSIELVTTALTSLRGAMKCLHIFSDIFTTSIPSHTAIQNWILQYGLHEFTSPIPKRRDWIYILDHTIEFGPQKCLVILGITKEELMYKDEPITFQQLRALTIEISRKTNSKQIKHSINKLIKKTGVPAQMVSDHGSDLKKAIEDTNKRHSTIKVTYDITHKCGIILKRLLENDILWNQFRDNYSYTKRKCVHSKFAFLAPKKLKDKSRWMNLDTCLDWANSIIEYKKNISEKMQSFQFDKKGYKKSFKELFGWIDRFEKRIQLWNRILEIISIARNEVKSNGLLTNTLDRFNKRVQMVQDKSEYVLSVIDELQRFLKEQTEGILPHQKFLGTSDAIESVFAKYKIFSARTPMKGVGKTVLTIPVFLSNITKEKIANALRNCNIKKMKAWINDNVGQSVFAQRKLAFASYQKNKCMKK